MIRSIEPSDLAAIKQLIDATQLFPSEMMDEMTRAYFDGNPENEIWLTAGDTEGKAVLFCGNEKMTEGTRNCFLIAVHPDHQGQGIGTELMQHLENRMRDANDRVLLVETSSLGEYDRTRAFYRKLGYEEEARIRDFYQAGEDKVVFRKAI